MTQSSPMPWTMGPNNLITDRDGNTVMLSGSFDDGSKQAVANTAALIALTKTTQQDQKTISELRRECDRLRGLGQEFLNASRNQQGPH